MSTSTSSRSSRRPRRRQILDRSRTIPPTASQQPARPTQERRPRQLPGYYNLIIVGGISPELHGPYPSSQRRHRLMHALYRTEVNEKNGDLPCWLNVSATGRVSVGYFPRDFFQPKG